MNGISQNQEMLVTTAFSVINTLVNGFLSMLPQIIELGLNLLVSLAMGISENLDTLIPSLIATILKIVETLTSPDSLSKIINAALVLIVKLAYGIIKAIPQLVDSAFVVIENLVTFLCDPENLAMLVSAALELVVALAGGLIAAIPQLLSAAGTLATNLSNNLKNRDWGQVGRNIINKILSGLKNAWENVKSWFTNAWNNLFSNRTVSVGANVSSGGVDGSHAGGLDYVPFDGYVAELHKGEQVLTAEEAKDYKRGGGKSVSVVQNIYSQAKTAADLLQEAKYQQERAVLFGV
jgi:phage-related protein